MSFGELLKNIRKEKGDTYRSLGEKLNFNFNYISQIEKGTSPVGKNFINKLIEIYPDKEKVLIEAYLEEVLPEKIFVKYNEIIEKSKDLSNNDNMNLLIDFMMKDINLEIKKEILKFMLTQRENNSYKNGTYEEDKEELDAIRKEIEKL